MDHDLDLLISRPKILAVPMGRLNGSSSDGRELAAAGEGEERLMLSDVRLGRVYANIVVKCSVEVSRVECNHDVRS